MTSSSRDVVVVGGGPAGCAFAITLRKYAPEISVTVLERAHHPRYHIGESTVPVVNSVFRDLGLFDRLYDGRFIRKMGVTFVWGRDRHPWDADYLQIEHMEGAKGVINVLGQDFTSLLREERRRDIPLTAINVLRSEFDHLLVQQARAMGAEVREGCRVTAARRDASGAAEAVDFEADGGGAGRIYTPFVIDASGLSSFLTRGDRQRDPAMANYAVVGYLSGADWKVLFHGRRDATTVFIASIPHGWIWYIPVAEDVLSVGVVTHRDHFKDRLEGRALEPFFWDSVRACPEIGPLVRGARLREDILPSGARVRAFADWASWARTPVGPGWAAVGDAAVFVDPILSSGLTMALQSGHRAAYTFNTCRRGSGFSAEDLWGAYADYLRGEAASYLTLARYFYGNNHADSSLWWQAQRLVNDAGRLKLDGRAAFTLATAGFFPTPGAISAEIMAPLLTGLSGTDADLLNVYHEDGLLADAALDRARLRIKTPFRLGLRTRPDERRRADGLLSVYHDLLPEGFALAHRTAASPCEVPPEMAPVVAEMQRRRKVSRLLARAPGLLPRASPAAARAATRALIRNAARKGLLEVVPHD